MTQPRSLWGAFISSFLIAALAFAPGTVWAQGFEFGEDEVQEVPDEGSQPPPEEDDEDTMVFGSEDLSKEDATEVKEKPSVAVVAVPGPNMTPERRSEPQSAMMDQAKEIPNIIAVGPEGALPALEQRNPQTCVTEPFCLGAVGEAADVDHLLLGRIKEGPSGLTLEVDYFDVENRLFMKYHSSQPVSTTGGLVEAVEPAFKDIFGIRDQQTGPEFGGDEDPSIVQDIIAWGSAGLAVVFVGTGIFFGLEASNAEDDVTAQRNEDGTFNLTQQLAQQQLRDAESDADTANIFYGLAAAMAVTSVVFFIIRGGSDMAEDQERVDLLDDLRIGPTVTDGGAGVGAAFTF